MEQSAQGALHRAAFDGDENAVRQCLADEEVLPEVNCKDGDGLTPLHFAAHSGHDRVVLILLDDPRVEVNCNNNGGRTPLHVAASNGHYIVVQILLADQRVEVNCNDIDGYTALHGASWCGRSRVVQLLLQDQRLDVNFTISLSGGASTRLGSRAALIEGATALHIAAQHNCAEVVQLLLGDPRTDVNCKNKNGHTPLMHSVLTATVENSVPTLRLLLNHPSVDLKDIKEVARANGKTYLLKLVDTARSARKENKNVEMEFVDNAKSAREDDKSVESLIEFIEGGEPLERRREKKQKKKKKNKSSPTENVEGDDADIGGLEVAEEDRLSSEPISEELSKVGEDSVVCQKMKKPKRKNKQNERKILKSAHENNLHGANETVETEKDKEGPSSHLIEDPDNPLTRELVAKEAELHELLESEVHLVESKGKEMSALLLALDELEDERHGVEKKVAEIDSQMGELQISRYQLVKQKEDKDRKLEKLLKKKNKLEKFIEETMSERKETKRRLDKEIEEIKVRLKETERTSKSEAQPESLMEFINDQIESKEKQLECPVCMEVASAPLFCCEDQHLICAECRPKVTTCPECRNPYPARPRRHRYLEEAAEELAKLKDKRAKILQCL